MHVPPRFAHSRPAWFARKAIVATRRATKAATEGRTRWAELWEAAAYTNKEAYRETRED